MSGDLAAAAPLVLVGAGKMGGALLSGWLDRGLPADAATAIDPAPPPDVAADMQARGVRLAAGPGGGPQAATLVLAVKPQVMESVLADVGPLVGPGTLVVSIAAGRTLDWLKSRLPPCALVRAMPNTPAQVGRGMTVLIAGDEVTAAQREIATALMEAVGRAAWIADERLMDAVTAVSGSGPAYVFLLAECLAEAGCQAGLRPDLAALLARTTVEGSGALLARSPLDPATLRRNVTSPGGTTAAALEILMGPDGLAPLLERAVAAAARRSRELAG